MAYRRDESVLHQKSYAFAIRVVNMVKFLRENKNEFVLSKQVLRSGTAIGALVRESEFAQSSADFLNKLYVALKEANETGYWLNILKDTGYMEEDTFDSMESDLSEIIALLVSSTKTLKIKIEEQKQ